jgi:hypothetical protein
MRPISYHIVGGASWALCFGSTGRTLRNGLTAFLDALSETNQSKGDGLLEKTVSSNVDVYTSVQFISVDCADIQLL